MYEIISAPDSREIIGDTSIKLVEKVQIDWDSIPEKYNFLTVNYWSDYVSLWSHRPEYDTEIGDWGYKGDSCVDSKHLHKALIIDIPSVLRNIGDYFGRHCFERPKK